LCGESIHRDIWIGDQATPGKATAGSVKEVPGVGDEYEGDNRKMLLQKADLVLQGF
jgi:hypothetical protein